MPRYPARNTWIRCKPFPPIGRLSDRRVDSEDNQSVDPVPRVLGRINLARGFFAYSERIGNIRPKAMLNRVYSSVHWEG